MQTQLFLKLFLLVKLHCANLLCVVGVDMGSIFMLFAVDQEPGVHGILVLMSMLC